NYAELAKGIGEQCYKFRTILANCKTWAKDRHNTIGAIQCNRWRPVSLINSDSSHLSSMRTAYPQSTRERGDSRHECLSSVVTLTSNEVRLSDTRSYPKFDPQSKLTQP